ncbi:FAD-dependent oxidoreductase [Noviherbaspirillum denitrificans]|uniref:Glutamate synthase n=1 Tax=Noviherbaspirillum denitrificans TaxID=1968433 RepID=A0A254TDZ4_9BURK|nr:FAD-dependent oxidoreductase [Noviherbaspirillum denitrificans]OWW18763.1 glutamate synthase [Noviherbaspirillum denitrificans]
MKPTDTSNPDFYHQVVNCQWSCPAHTPVPEYLRQVAAGHYTEAYMLNWRANVFPGVLGRVCDRPCETACRRARVEGADNAPVAVCRLKRTAADYKSDVQGRLPKPAPKSGKRVACVGAGPASLTVARDLALQGHQVTVFDGEKKAGGFMRSQIPKFRLPDEVIDEETGYVLDMGVEFRSGERIGSLKALLGEGYDAVFVGCGAPRGRDLDVPGRTEAAANIHLGIDWLASVSFGHVTQVGQRVIVLGGGNTAMDCCRSALRLGGEDVKVIVRSGFEEMKASPWEKEDAIHEGITILNYMVPKSFTHENGKLTGMTFEKVKAVYDAKGKRSLVPTGEPDELVPCDEVLVAVGQENAFPWIERDIGMQFDEWDMPVVDRKSMQSTVPNVFFGGDAAFGPKNIITAVAHGHEAAVSIDRFLSGEDVAVRPAPSVTLVSQKMGIHEWSFDNIVSLDRRHKVPLEELHVARKSIKIEVERGFTPQAAAKEAQRCLNCDVQSIFTASRCIECDACIDICPMDALTLTENGEEQELRGRLKAPSLHPTQPLYVSAPMKTGRIMVKDEDLCLHCSLCAERCPTGAWDMQKFTLKTTQAGAACRDQHIAQLRKTV